MPALPNAQLTHVGIFVRDLKVMTDFYCRTLGMVITDGGPFAGRELAFLSRNPNEHHQLVMIQDPAQQPGMSALGQISFRLETLEALREFYAFLTAEKAAGLEGRNHGNSWSLYFFDPEGNKIEIYTATPWQISQPWRAPLDLTAPADEILAETERLLSQNSTVRPVEQWSREMAQRMGFSPAQGVAL